MQVEQPGIQVKHCKSSMRSIGHLETEYEQFKPSLKVRFALEKVSYTDTHPSKHVSGIKTEYGGV